MLKKVRVLDGGKGGDGVDVVEREIETEDVLRAQGLVDNVVQVTLKSTGEVVLVAMPFLEFCYDVMWAEE